MKSFKISYLIFISVIFFSCGKKAKAQAPDAVKATFQNMYPGEDDPDWHKDDHGNYESNFKIDGIKYRADFSEVGKWIETETSIDVKDLPKVIRDRIKEDYGSEDITEVEKVEHHSKGLFYDVEFKQKGKNMDVEFKASGEIINK